MNPELPKIANSVYTATTHFDVPNDMWIKNTNQTVDSTSVSPRGAIPLVNAFESLITTASKIGIPDNSTVNKFLKGELPVTKINEEARRYIQVFVVDPDSKIPLDKAVLYKGDPQMTDLSNEEFFFTIPIMALLKTHNEFRKSHVIEDDFATTEKTRKRHLKPIRIKDLSMTVVTIAQF